MMQMLSQKRDEQPRIDQQSTRVIVETLVGNKNSTLETGNWLVTKSRIFSGNMYRLSVYSAYLQRIGIDVSQDITNILAGTIGFCKDFPDGGMREEAIQVLTQQELPRVEKLKEGGTGILKRGEPL